MPLDPALRTPVGTHVTEGRGLVTGALVADDAAPWLLPPERLGQPR